MAKKVATTQTPQVETSKVETPKVETPKAETPKAEVPKAEKPKVEKPKAEKTKVEKPKSEKGKAEKSKPRGLVPEASARAVIPTAPDCVCPTCSANNWIETDPDDTTPPALAYKCVSCGVRHVPIVGAGASGVTGFWVLRLLGATKATGVGGANLINLQVEFEDLITGDTDTIATTNAIAKTSVGSFPDQINYQGPSGIGVIGFLEAGTGNSNAALFEIQFTSVTGVSIVSNIFIGFKNGELGVIFTQPELVSASGNNVEISSTASRATVNGSALDPIALITGYSYYYRPIAGNMAILAQSLVQGSTPGNYTYTATATMQNQNKMTLITGDVVNMSSQAVVVVVP